MRNKKQMKKKILFLVQLPEPTHGSSLVNLSIKKSKEIKKIFKISFIDISTTNVTNEINSFKFKKIFIFICIVFRLFKKLIFFKPDKVYISLSVLGLGFIKDSILVIISKLFGFKLIFHLHRKGVHKVVKKSLLYNLYYKFIFNNVEVIHLSNVLFNDIKLIKDQSEKSYVVHNGIYNQSLKKIKKDKICTFVFISNLFKFKGIDLLLKSILLLNKQKYSKKFKVKIIGECTNDFKKKDLNNFLNKNKIFKNASFMGAKYDRAKFKQLSSSHVMVFPTKDDCFPLCILEAMSCGLPVITSHEGAIPEMIKNNRNGILLKKLKPSLIANAMKIFITKHTILKKYSKNNLKDFNQKYTMNLFQNNLTNVLKKSLMNN
jgi:glycosyltransferase involved in cell wall biosynthesis